MKIRYGNLIEIAHEYDVIVHGCNCFNTMGAGFARQVARNWPDAEYVDSLTTKGAVSKLGKISMSPFVYDTRGVFVVVNAYTQFDYRGDSMRVSYEAVGSCFEQVAALFPDKRIAYPKIGAGLGGGDWGVISQIIDKELDGADHTLVLLS